MFLSTKLLPRNDDEFFDKSDKSDEPENVDGSKSHVEAVERFNDSVNDISTSYLEAADDVLSKLMISSGGAR